MAKKKPPPLIDVLPSPFSIPEDPVSEGEAYELRRILLEIQERRIESLRLYTPLPPLQTAFHESTAHERVVIGSNRGGKTLCCAAEVAMAVTGQDPHGKWPKQNGIFYLVGKDQREVGQVMWKKLSRAGAFKIIRDPLSKKWRVFQPNFDDRALAKLAPPLIPHRFIEDVAWEDKKENLPKIVRLTTGWEMHFFTSGGKPPHGADIDGAWFDEEIIDGEWYSEIAARLIDRNGKFIWSATPQEGTEQLYQLYERAEQERLDGIKKRSIEVFKLTSAANIYVGDEEKATFAAKLDEDQYRVRVEGEFALKATIVFPTYSPRYHHVDMPKDGIPKDWTRYLAIDPGHQICAVLFCAIPPEGNEVWLYDELYIPKCDAIMFGRRMKDKLVGEDIRAFIIDYHEARKTEAGSGKTIGDQYTEQLEKHNIRSELTGSGFIHGDDNISAGLTSIRELLNENDFGEVRLRIVASSCPNLISEMKGYRYKREKDAKGTWMVTDKPMQKRCHLIDCLRYLAQYNPKWYPSKKMTMRRSSVWNAFKQWTKSNDRGIRASAG